VKLRLGLSTCPNDTFAFHAILERRIDLRGLEFEPELLDVQQLNDGLLAGRYDVSKASFYAALLLAGNYGVVRSGVANYPRTGFLGLLGAGALNRAWKPSADARPTAWEAVHHLADRLIDGGGTLEAGRLMGELGGFRDPAQALVYRLHAIAAKKGWTKDQERYNALIGSWSDLLAIAASERDGLF